MAAYKTDLSRVDARWLGDAVHDLCQPLTTLECLLGMSLPPRGAHTEATVLRETIEAALVECRRAAHVVWTIQEHLYRGMHDLPLSGRESGQEDDIWQVAPWPLCPEPAVLADGLEEGATNGWKTGWKRGGFAGGAADGAAGGSTDGDAFGGFGERGCESAEEVDRGIGRNAVVGIGSWGRRGGDGAGGVHETGGAAAG